MSDGYDSVINVDLASDVSAAVKAKAQIEQLAAAAHRLQNEFDAGAISEAKFNAGLDRLQASALKANAAFDQAMTGANAVGGASGAATNKLMVMGQTLDDLQYVPTMGLRPIINNLMQISPVAGIAAIGVQLLVSQLDNFASLVGKGHIKTATEEMEELKKQATLTAAQYERLGQLQRGEKATEAIRDARPEAEKKRDDAVTKAIGEAGGLDVIREGLLKSINGGFSNQAGIDAAQKALDATDAYIADRRKQLADRPLDMAQPVDRDFADKVQGQIKAAEALRKERKEALDEAQSQGVEGIVKRAANARDNPDAAAELAGYVRNHPEAFGAGAKKLLEDLDAAIAGRDVDKEKKDAEQKAQDAKRADDKRGDELAKDLQGRYNVARAAGGEVSEADIRSELGRAGVAPAEVAKQAGAVLGKLQAGYAEELRERAGKKGLDVAGANADILADDAARAEREDAPARRAREQDDKRAAELAKPLQDRFNLESARAGRDDAVTLDEVRSELGMGGASDSEIDQHAEAVLGKLQDGYNEELRKRAGKGGTDVAGANDSIVADVDKKARADLDAKLAAARQSGEKAEADRAEQFKRATAGTGVDGRTRDALMRSQIAGEDPGAAAERIGAGIARNLVSQGMDPAQARAAADDYVVAQQAKLRDDVIGRGLQARDFEPAKAPERVAVADFARQVESAGMDLQKRSVSLQEQMLERLTEIERKSGAGYARAAPDT